LPIFSSSKFPQLLGPSFLSSARVHSPCSVLHHVCAGSRRKTGRGCEMQTEQTPPPAARGTTRRQNLQQKIIPLPHPSRKAHHGSTGYRKRQRRSHCLIFCLVTADVECKLTVQGMLFIPSLLSRLITLSLSMMTQRDPRHQDVFEDTIFFN